MSKKIFIKKLFLFLFLMINVLLYLLHIFSIYSFFIIFTIFVLISLKNEIRKKEFFSPKLGISFSYLFYFILPYFLYENGIYINNTHENTLLLIMISFLAYITGYELINISNKNYYVRNFLKNIEFNKINIILIGISIFSFKFLHYLSGYKTNVINSKGIASLFDLILIPLDVFTLLYLIILAYMIIFYNKNKFNIIIYFMIISIDLMTGSKSRILFEIFPLIFWYLQIYNKIPYKYIFVLIIVIELIFPITLAMKLNKEADVSLIELLNLAVVLLKTGDLSIFDMIIGRANMIEPLERIMSNPEKIGIFLSYLPSQSSIFPLFFIAFIPRFLWTNRPDSNPGDLFGYTFGWLDETNAYVSASLPGELFMNYGWSSLLVFFALGMVHRLVYIILFKKNNLIIFKSIYIYFFLYIIVTGFESYFVVRYNLFIKNIIIMLFLWLFIKPFIFKRRLV